MGGAKGRKWMRDKWWRSVQEEELVEMKSVSDTEDGRKILVLLLGSCCFQSRMKIVPSGSSRRTECCLEERCFSSPRDGSCKLRSCLSSLHEDPSGKEATGGSGSTRPTQKYRDDDVEASTGCKRKGVGVWEETNSFLESGSSKGRSPGTGSSRASSVWVQANSCSGASASAWVSARSMVEGENVGSGVGSESGK